MSNLNEELSLVVGQEDLGTIQTLRHRGKRVRYRLPKEIESQVTLRFRGRGRIAGRETGDLLLHVSVDRGRDVRGVLWLSENEARSGCEKKIAWGTRCYTVKVPPRSENGHVLRFRGLGEVSEFGAQRGTSTRGDSLVSLRVFPDRVTANIHPVETMSAEDLSLEGWIYRRTDEILALLRRSPFSIPPFTAVRVADLFNESGWEAIGAALTWHLGLQFSQFHFESSSALTKPGQCFTEVRTRKGKPDGLAKSTISIHSRFLGDPFAVTAILAHEFCHLLEFRHFGGGRSVANPTGSELMEMERTVDLLVFLFGLGEFQMRVARQNQMTLGYFNQGLFERMHVLWSRKQREFVSHHS